MKILRGGEEPQGGPPDNIRIAKVTSDMKTKIEAGNITVDDLIKEDGDWNNCIEANAGESLEVYMAVRHNGNVAILQGDNVKVPQENKEYIDVSYSNENKTFTLTFKKVTGDNSTWIEATYDGETYELGISISSAKGEADNNSGLTVEWKEEKISSGTIIIEEGCGYSIPIYYDGIQNDSENGGEDAFAKSDNEDVCGAGVSPDGAQLELYLSQNAKAGDSCEVTLYYGNGEEQKTITLTVKVIPGIRLENANTVIYPYGTLSSDKSVTVKLVTTNEENQNTYIKSDYTVSVSGNAVCKITKNSNGEITLEPVGNGYCNLNVKYKEKTYSFTWQSKGVADTSDAANIKMEIGETQKENGDKFTLRSKSSFSGYICLNGNKLSQNEYSIKTAADWYGDRCKVSQNEDGSFILTNGSETGYYDLTVTVNKGDKKLDASFKIQIQNPSEYILQFYNLEKVGSSWNNTGFATIGILEQPTQKKYVKFIVTDEEMRRVDDEYFVDIATNDIKVCVYDSEANRYVDVKESENPFSFKIIDESEKVMEITYDRRKDKYGPAYMLFYSNYENDKYLKGNKPEKAEENASIFLWTRKTCDFMKWGNKLKNNGHHWKYDAHICTHEGFEKKNNDCDVKSTAVKLSSTLLANDTKGISTQSDTGQITITDETVLDIETDLATVSLDDDVLSKISGTGKDVTLNVVRLEDEDANDAEYKDLYGSAKWGKSDTVLDLTLEYQSESSSLQKISELGGTVTVSLDYELKNSNKTPTVYYYYVESGEVKKAKIDADKVKYNATANNITFETTHFSIFAVEETTVSSSEGGNTSGSGSVGGGAVAAPEVTTDTAASTTTSKTDVKLTESSNTDGTSSSTANVSVSAANQKEILKQVAAKKSANIVLNVSEAEAKNADAVEVTLDKSFIESIINDTNATLTVKTPLGDKIYTQDELKALAAAADGKTVTITIAKSDEKSNEEMQQQAQAGVAKAAMKARSSKTAKGNIKIVFRPDDETESFISEMKALGYTVKYRFYRSTKKSSGYKSMLTKSEKTYINTGGKNGTRYYYKVQVRVYDENGKCIAKTALKQCKYATRIFG